METREIKIFQEKGDPYVVIQEGLILAPITNLTQEYYLQQVLSYKDGYYNVILKPHNPNFPHPNTETYKIMAVVVGTPACPKGSPMFGCK